MEVNTRKTEPNLLKKQYYLPVIIQLRTNTMHSKTSPLSLAEAMEQVDEFILNGATKIELAKVDNNKWTVEAWGP